MPDLATCHRCPAPPVGVVAVSELDEGLAAGPPVTEIRLCASHLADVAVACGFDRPGDLREVKRAG